MLGTLFSATGAALLAVMIFCRWLVEPALPYLLRIVGPRKPYVRYESDDYYLYVSVVGLIFLIVTASTIVEFINRPVKIVGSIMRFVGYADQSRREAHLWNPEATRKKRKNHASILPFALSLSTGCSFLRQSSRYQKKDGASTRSARTGIGRCTLSSACIGEPVIADQQPVIERSSWLAGTGHYHPASA